MVDLRTRSREKSDFSQRKSGVDQNLGPNKKGVTAKSSSFLGVSTGSFRQQTYLRLNLVKRYQGELGGWRKALLYFGNWSFETESTSEDCSNFSDDLELCLT